MSGEVDVLEWVDAEKLREVMDRIAREFSGFGWGNDYAPLTPMRLEEVVVEEIVGE